CCIADASATLTVQHKLSTSERTVRTNTYNKRKGAAMKSSRTLLFTAVVCSGALLAACSEPTAPTPTASQTPAPMAAPAATMSQEMPGNTITGEGFDEPSVTVTQNWGALPEGRTWGSTAGIDIDPNDGHIWAYERCGAGSFGAGAPVTCDTNLVDPIFKFDRNTGEVLANFGAGVMVTPH